MYCLWFLKVLRNFSIYLWSYTVPRAPTHLYAVAADFHGNRFLAPLKCCYSLYWQMKASLFRCSCTRHTKSVKRTSSRCLNVKTFSDRTEALGGEIFIPPPAPPPHTKCPRLQRNKRYWSIYKNSSHPVTSSQRLHIKSGHNGRQCVTASQTDIWVIPLSVRTPQPVTICRRGIILLENSHKGMFTRDRLKRRLHPRSFLYMFIDCYVLKKITIKLGDFHFLQIPMPMSSQWIRRKHLLSKME